MVNLITVSEFGFTELNEGEIQRIQGGSSETAGVILMITGAIVVGILAPVTCGASLAFYGTSAVLGLSTLGVGVATYAQGGK